MLDYKRKQEEELTKRMLEERNREKAEDRAARERIKQQIALVSVKCICFLKILFIYLIRGEREERGKTCAREIQIGCFLHALYWRPGPQPRHMP